MAEYNTYTTVESLYGGDIVLVGENHSSERSAELMRRVLRDVEPNTVCVESTSPRRVSGTGMRVADKWAQRADVPLIAIDNLYHSYLPEAAALEIDFNALLDVANTFTYDVREDGDIDPRCIDNSRQAVYELFGSEVYDAMYTRREVDMARRLETARYNYRTPIVAGVGAFHVPALVEQLQSAEPEQSIDDTRVRT